MKTKLLCFCLLPFAVGLSAFAQGTALTYQGRLNDGAGAANGIYDLRFTIYDSTNLPGVVVAGPLTNSATGVSNGLFTVTLDFGAGVFAGADRWLELGVRTNGNGAFAPLNPRQKLTAAPYAITAGNVTGILPGAGLSGTYGGTLTLNNAGNNFTGNGAGLTGLSAANIGSGTLADSRLSGNVALLNRGNQTFTGSNSFGNVTIAGPAALSFGATTRQMLNLWDTVYAIGVQSYGQYFRVDNGAGFFWYQGGTHSDSHGDPGVGGATMMELDYTGQLSVFGTSGNGVQGDSTSEAASGVYGENLSGGGYGVAGRASGSGLAVYGDNLSTNGWAGYFNGRLGMAGSLYTGTTLLLHLPGTQNLFLGPGAGNPTISGNDNTGVGFNALHNNTGGIYNTATGSGALFSNTNGQYNVADGAYAMYFSQAGFHDTACGAFALYSNRFGWDNVAAGYEALYSVFDGGINTAVGYRALHTDSSGSFNTGCGALALFYNKDGHYNTACGYQSLISLTNGSSNIALGELAGGFLTWGSSNICIGHPGVDGDNGTMRLGVQGTQTRTFIAGISGVTASGGVPVYVSSSGQLGTLTSSARFKENIQSMDAASDVLLSLRPVTFHYKPELDSQGIPQFGLIAEEVAKVDPDLVVRDDHNELYSVRYEAVNAMLLNEFLKQHRTVEKQDREIQQLHQENRGLEQRLEALEQIIRQQKPKGK